MRRHLIPFLIETAKVVSAASIILATTASGISYFFGGVIEQYTKMPEVISQYGTVLDSFGRDISKLRQEVESLRTIPKLIEYQLIATKVDGPCKAGDYCPVQFQVKRTTKGTECGQADATYIVRNHFGLEYIVETTQQQTTTVGKKYTNINYEFKVPEKVQSGMAEYYVELKFSDCKFMKSGEVITENSPSLRFNVVEDK